MTVKRFVVGVLIAPGVVVMVCAFVSAFAGINIFPATTTMDSFTRWYVLSCLSLMTGIAGMILSGK